MIFSLEAAMMHDSPYEAIDPKDKVAVAQRTAFSAALEVNSGTPTNVGAVALAQRLQAEASEKAMDANLNTPSMLPPQQGNEL